LTPNDIYSGRTAPLTSKRFIVYIYSTNTGTEYFKHGIHSPFLSLKNAICFIILTYLIPVFSPILYTVCAKIKKNNSGTKRLINRDNDRVFPLLWQFLFNFLRMELNKCSVLRTYTLFIYYICLDQLDFNFVTSLSFLCFEPCGNRDSSVGVVTMLRAGRSTDLGLISDIDNSFISSPACPNRVGNTINILCNGCSWR